MKKKAAKRTAKASGRQSTLNFPTSSEPDVIAESTAAVTSTKSASTKRRKQLTADFADDADKTNASHCDSSVPLSSAPTERNTIAQGKKRSAAALGQQPLNIESPEGATDSNSWMWTNLGALCERITKGSSPNWQGFDYCNEGIVFVRSQNVGWGEIKLGEVAHLPPAFNEKEKKSVLKTDDVLLNLVGASIGRACVATPEVDGGNVNQAVAVIRVRPQTLLPKFLSQFLVSPFAQSRIHSEKVDVARANFSLEDVRALQVPVPPLPEQHRIVAEIEKQFTRLDAGVAALKRVQANLKRYRAAVLKAACEGKLVPTEAEMSRTAVKSPPFETGEQLLQRILTERRQNWQGRGEYKEPLASEVNRLHSPPEGWAWATVEQVSSLVQYGSSSKTSEDGSGIPVLRMGNIQTGRFDMTNLKFLPNGHDEFPALLLVEGDLLFNRTNSAELVGKTAVFKGNPAHCSFASYLIRVRFVRGCCPIFVSYFINSPFGRAWVASVVNQQVGQANVNGTKLQALSIPLPPVAEQTRIVAEVERRLSVVDELESVVSANLQRATRLRQSILQKAFTGALTGEATCKDGLQVQRDRS